MSHGAPPSKAVFLTPGELYFGKGHTRISTLLGSCVSVTLWHPRLHIGGMCHYMLTERQRTKGTSLDGRYADEAFELFLMHIAAAKTDPGEYQAKIFGGARMLDDLQGNRPDIGQGNVAFGKSLLNRLNIPLFAEHVGGSRHRKLHFDLWTGAVWVASPDGAPLPTRKIAHE